MVTEIRPDLTPRERVVSGDRNTQSVPTLLHRLTHELSVLFRQELALVSAELTQVLGRTLAAAAAASAGGLILFAGLLVLLAAAVLGLSQLMAAWLAALLVGFVVSMAGAAALVIGARRVPAAMKPKRIARSLKKDKDVLTRKSS